MSTAAKLNSPASNETIFYRDFDVRSDQIDLSEFGIFNRADLHALIEVDHNLGGASFEIDGKEVDADGRRADPIADMVNEAVIERLTQTRENQAFRDLSGRFNNLNNPEFGAVDSPFIRLTYADLGTDGAPRGVVNGVQTLPNERLISNMIVDQDTDGDGMSDRTNSINGSNLFLMSFGQFFDHGLDLQLLSETETYSIPLSPDDELYSFSDDGNPFNDFTAITISRTEPGIDPNTGEPYDTRSPINTTAPFSDQNQTFGSTPAIKYYLRESARDENGDLIRNEDGTLVKLANLLFGDLDAGGRPLLPTYRQILINNGVDETVIAQAEAANDIELLRSAEGFVDHLQVHDPLTGQPDTQPLLVDLRFDALLDNPQSFNLTSLLDHFVAGDGRANENIALTPVHLIFFREHAFWVNELREETNGAWTEDEYYEVAKAAVTVEYQRLIFDEFIDALAGRQPLGHPHGLTPHPRVDASISAEFAAAVYRLGHSMLTETLPFEAPDGTLQHVSLVEAFNNPRLFAEIGPDALIKGETRFAHEELDHMIVDAVRNQLFGQALDLGAINLARGREFGLPSLNEVRRTLYENGSSMAQNGTDVTRALYRNPELKPYENWEEFGANLRDPALLDDFMAVYDSVDDVDLWIGGLAEKVRDPGNGQLGTTFSWVFWEQTDRIQDGDRFYYGRFFDSGMFELIETQTFSDLILRNTDIDFLPDDVFQTSIEERMTATEEFRVFTDEHELIIANDLPNIVYGEGGDDTFYLQAGDDIAYGGAGEDGIRGEEGDDTIYAGAGHDRVTGGPGNDTLYGGASRDDLRGNQGQDIISGGPGNDEVQGNQGDDWLYGESGNDVVRGGLGNDVIDGGAGNDVLENNGGDDIILTGEGSDTIILSDSPGAVTVRDFDVMSDRVDFRLFGVKNMADLMAVMTVADTPTGVEFSNGDRSVLLEEVFEDDLTTDNIRFTSQARNIVYNQHMEDRNIVVAEDASLSRENIFANAIETDGVMRAFQTNDRSVGWFSEESDSVAYAQFRGNVALDLDTSAAQDTISQVLPTTAGLEYNLIFDAMGAVGNNCIEVLWNSEVVGVIEAGEEWGTNSFSVTGTGGNDTLSFRESGGDLAGTGAYVDNVFVFPDGLEADNFMFIGTEADETYHDQVGYAEEIDGMGGIDTFVINAPFSSDFSVELGEDGRTSVSVFGTTLVILENLEQIRFDDAELFFEDTWVFV